MKELKSVILNHTLFFTDNVLYLYGAKGYLGSYIVTCYKGYLLLSDKHSNKTRIYDPLRCNKNILFSRFANNIQIMYIS